MFEKINNDLKKFYGQNLQSFGNTAKGVGWKNQEAQQVRFDQLTKLFAAQPMFSVNDLGCGVADFVSYLFDKGFTNFTYTGYDVLEEMVQISTENYRARTNCSFVHINDATELDEADYTVASGIFNIRYEISDADWLAYIVQTITEMDAKSRKGFAFNALTSYSDKNKMQDYLYYSDPLYLFDYCKKNFSRNVALLHDYYQYDFTIIVRKG